MKGVKSKKTNKEMLLTQGVEQPSMLQELPAIRGSRVPIRTGIYIFSCVTCVPMLGPLFRAVLDGFHRVYNDSCKSRTSFLYNKIINYFYVIQRLSGKISRPHCLCFSSCMAGHLPDSPPVSPHLERALRQDLFSGSRRNVAP